MKRVRMLLVLALLGAAIQWQTPGIRARANGSLVNNNAGATGTSQFTQSQSATVAFGDTVVVAYNDAGSNAAVTNKFTGVSRSTNGGLTFTDMGTLPTSAGGDAGDPTMARNSTTGRHLPGDARVHRHHHPGLPIGR
jgi:hypothetical protein